MKHEKQPSTKQGSFTSVQMVHTHTRTLLHTNTFTHRPSYTQSVKLLHTNPFTHKHFDTQKLRHTDPIYTYIQHQLNRKFSSVFAQRASFRAKGLLRHKWAVAKTPLLCVLFCLPFRHLFREPFAMQGFSFAASMCLKYTFASFRGKHVTKVPRFPQWSASWNLWFQAQRT